MLKNACWDIGRFCLLLLRRLLSVVLVLPGALDCLGNKTNIVDENLGSMMGYARES